MFVTPRTVSAFVSGMTLEDHVMARSFLWLILLVIPVSFQQEKGEVQYVRLHSPFKKVRVGGSWLLTSTASNYRLAYDGLHSFLLIPQ